MSAAFPPVSNVDKPLVIQFTVKHEQNIDCGGGYIKLFDCKLDQADMHGESPYNIMFGPDICGPGTKKVHVIFEHKGKNHLIKKDIRCKDDVFTHLYTLVVNTDGTYEVLIDNESAQTGSLLTTGTSCRPRRLRIPRQRSQMIGLIRPSSMTLRMSSQRTGTRPSTSRTPTQRSPRTGTMRWTVSGSLP